uniref:trafficking protein particle complex subunit 10 n=1 Tax=Pristiophorus japonicus TaxID=55135 RepID=UPI00398F688A
MEAADEKLLIFTMENRPLATCAGDQALFSSVYSILVQQLPREPMEWRRSYGRPPKMIHLEANFVQFKEELIPKEGNRALLTFPFLHIFWTDCCDTEVYKATAKDEITKWQNILKAYSSSDWLIVVVESEAKKKNKTNILPRTSIVDKIRNDFCNKQSDRCVVLSDPLKDSSRTQESWNTFFSKLRTLLLMSFTKNLGRFEDDMRTMREKRTEAGWSFCEYFMVQEELAFVFEMLQQFEDALVQYDELDALFTQYVVNYGAGDGANWLTSFCQPVRSWNGLVLRKPIDMEKREFIQKNKATLLDLRSYLFSRQCTLLIFLQRPWEVAQRALELLHNCVQELNLLEVSVPVGALDCWVFLSCLEVLQRIEGCCDQVQLENNCCHTVGLWSYATEKVLEQLVSWKYLQVCVHNLSEVGFQLFDPRLLDVYNSSDVTFMSLNSLKQQHIYNRQATFFLWELTWSQEPGSFLHCHFSVAFAPLTGQELASMKPYTYELKLDNFCTLYDVKAEIFPPLGAEMCKMGTLCNLEVSIVRLSDLTEVDKDEALAESDGYCTTRLMYEVVDNSSNWAVCGKSSGVVSMPVAARATHKVHMEVMPLFAGFLPFPDVKLFKYLPFQPCQPGQTDTDSWIENDTLSLDKNLDDQVEISSLRSRGSTHSSGSSEHKGVPMPRLLPFSTGQVFNTSASMQILVLPSQDDHMLEVNVT